MRVVLTEKSSVATLIATALGGRRNGQWYSATWRGQPLTIAYASGHLFEELSPSEIVPTMNWTDPSSLLPVPYRIGLKKKVPKEKNDQARIAALIGGLMQLIPQATDMILATDADREGEAIGRTILKAAKFDKGFRRLWLAGGMDQQSILNALDNLKPSTFTDGMYQAQQARSVADWQSQITTRALTIQARCQLMGAHLGQGSGPSSAVSCGRVQSPTLYMVWDRDQRIQNFVPMAYFQPAIYVTQEGLTAAQYAVESDDEEDDNTLTDSNRAEGFRLTYRWPKVAAYPAVIPGTQWDESPRKPGTYSLRFTDAQMATNYERTLAAFVGQSTELRVESKKSLRHPPKPFSLTTAGVYLNKKHRMKTAQADEAIADLYLKGHVSYPRTEAQELPLSEYPAARGILEAVAAVPGMEAAANAPCVIDPNAKVPGCYTSKEDMPHPALSPTASIPDLNALTANERHAYLAICQRYIEAHYPPAELDRVLVWTSVGSPGLLG